MTSKTRMFAIHIAQRQFAKINIQNKMAAGQGVIDFDQVVELVLNNSDDEENDKINVSQSPISDKEAFKQTLVGFLDSLEGGTAFNKTFFRDSALDMIKPLVDISWKEPLQTGEMEAFRLLSSSFHFLPVVRTESVHWLNAIYRRLSCKKRIRSPHYAEIRRDIPYGIFKILLRVVKNVDVAEFSPPHCFYANNRAAEVISFTTCLSTTKLFTLLSGYEDKMVKSYFKRTLAGRRRGHKVELLVSDSKDFGFMYNFKKGQLTISFHYGEWNVHGFPQHS